MTNRSLIEQAILNNPAAKPSEIAAELNVGTHRVYYVRRTMAHRITVPFNAKNAAWLDRQTRKLGVSIGELVNACITDVRTEDEQT